MKIYFDENLPKTIARAFRELQCHRHHEGVEIVNHTTERFGVGAKDEDWLPILGEEGDCVVITEDTSMHRNIQLAKMIRKLKIVIVFLRPPDKGYLYWEMVSVIIKHWAEIKEWGAIGGPAAYEIGTRKKRLWPKNHDNAHHG